MQKSRYQTRGRRIKFTYINNNNMRNQIQPSTTKMKINKSYPGETIEQKMKRVTENKEPIKDGSPRIFTDRKDGVQPQYNIRTDRFELAVEATDKITKQHIAKREERIGQQAKKNMEKEAKTEKPTDGGAEPIAGK